jgi:hypothetical protein
LKIKREREGANREREREGASEKISLILALAPAALFRCVLTVSSAGCGRVSLVCNLSQHSQKSPVSFENRCKVRAGNDLKQKIAGEKWCSFLQIPIISMFAHTFQQSHTPKTSNFHNIGKKHPFPLRIGAK